MYICRENGDPWDVSTFSVFPHSLPGIKSMDILQNVSWASRTAFFLYRLVTGIRSPLNSKLNLEARAASATAKRNLIVRPKVGVMIYNAPKQLGTWCYREYCGQWTPPTYSACREPVFNTSVFKCRTADDTPPWKSFHCGLNVIAFRSASLSHGFVGTIRAHVGCDTPRSSINVQRLHLPSLRVYRPVYVTEFYWPTLRHSYNAHFR